MGDIIQCNIRGVKTENLRDQKVQLVSHILSNNKTRVLSLQETRITNDNQIPKDWLNFKHLYHIVSSNATEIDPGSGIIVFVKKTEDVLKTNAYILGRFLHLKLLNQASLEEFNFFSFYGKSNINMQSAKIISKKLDESFEKCENQKIILCGDFNFVTSMIDRNSSTFTNTDNTYRNEWEQIEIKYNLIDVFRHHYPKLRNYTFNQSGGSSKSRIDRFYASGNCLGRISKTKNESKIL